MTGVILLGTLPPVLGFLLGNYWQGAYDSASPQRIINIFSLISVAPVPLFLLPLGTLHRQLVSEVEGALVEYAEVCRNPVHHKSGGDGPLDEGAKSDLATIRQLQEDAQRVHNWPFDTGILARLLAIILSVSAILLSGYIRDLLKF